MSKAKYKIEIIIEDHPNLSLKLESKITDLNTNKEIELSDIDDILASPDRFSVGIAAYMNICFAMEEFIKTSTKAMGKDFNAETKQVIE
jgi:hypothetical protein